MTHKLIACSISLLFVASRVEAVDNLAISIQNTNIVLSWSSLAGQSYIVQSRSSLSTNVAWVTLTNNMAPATGTNRSKFTIAGVVPKKVPFNGPAGNGLAGKKGSKPPPLPGQGVLKVNGAVAQADSFPPVQSCFYRVVRVGGPFMAGYPEGLMGTTPVGAELGVIPPGATVTGFIVTDAAGAAVRGLVNQPVSQGLAARWDTTTVTNGNYSLKATLSRGSNSFPSLPRTVVVTNLDQPVFGIGNLAYEDRNETGYYSDSYRTVASSISLATPDAMYGVSTVSSNSGYLNSLSTVWSGPNWVSTWRSNSVVTLVETNGWSMSPVSWDVCSSFSTNGWHYSSYFEQWLRTDDYPKGLAYVYYLSPVALPYSTGTPFFGPLFPNYSAVQLPAELFGQTSYLDTNVGPAIPMNYAVLPNSASVEISPDFSNSVPTWYSFGTSAFKMSVPYIEWVSQGQLTEPEYPVCGYQKSTNLGVGYGDAVVNGELVHLYCELKALVGTTRGVAFTNTDPDEASIFVLSESRANALIPRDSAGHEIWPEFHYDTNAYTWNQDVTGEMYIYNHTSGLVVPDSSQAMAGTASPPGRGNDNVVLDDHVPDHTSYAGLYLPDAPGIHLKTSSVTNAPKGVIIAKRMGARQWLNWNGAIVSSIMKWNLDLTCIKTSNAGVSPATLKVIRATYGFGDKFTPLTSTEGESLWTQYH